MSAGDSEPALTPAELATLRAVMDRIVPADHDPGATGFGAEAYVTRMLARDAAPATLLIRDGLAALGPDFVSLTPAEQDATLRKVTDEAWFVALVRLTSEGVYADPGNGGNKDAASWAMVGYAHGLPEGPNGPPKVAPDERTSGHIDGSTDYDVIIVGAGAGGGVAACVLAEAGKRVLIIERGPWRTYANSGHRDHLRNQWLSAYGINAGPAMAGNPRVAVAPDGSERVVAPNDREYQNLADGVGSGTAVYGMQAWRFHPDDFRMASRYGVPDGSSLTDWPIGYDDLAPWYDRAEWEIGVGGNDHDRPHDGARTRGYPMPAVPAYAASRLLREGAAKLGIGTVQPPMLVNTVPRDGRAACIGCGSCVGFHCPSDAKNGTQNTVIPRALATGHCDLLTSATVARVDTDERGKVSGVTYISDDGVRHTVRAHSVVLACGAIETARLLLLSASSSEPAGLGNAHDLVGRNLQGHYYPTVFGLFDEVIHNSRGPGVTVATCDYNHGNDGVIGGAMLADDFVMFPAYFWHQAWPPGLDRWGQAAKDFMRDNFRRVLQVKGPVHEIPNPDCRVTLDPNVRDRHGLAVARLSGVAHDETVRTARFIHGKARAWVEAAGAKQTWGRTPVPQFSAHSHQAGTCRMGNDPRTSVTDPYGRVWGHDNLFIADGSVHPTNGGYNPVLTIMALAFRAASHIASA